jgi:hypothetical protein
MITSTYTVERNEAGESISITWNFKKYSTSTIEVQSHVVDGDGNTEEFEVSVANESDLIDTYTQVYSIPEDQRTTATHEEPHVHENEMAFQTAYQTWCVSAELEYI